MPLPVSEWTVDYGAGPQPCTVPHAWRQDVDVRWEGPAIYRTTFEVPETGGWLVFWGVSYGANVFLNPPPPLMEEGGREVEIQESPSLPIFDSPSAGSSTTPPSVIVSQTKGGAPAPSAPNPLSLFSSVEKGEGKFRHHGIWDAFSVPLAGFEGQSVEVTVKVVKNGGPTFPVRDVASGFLPFVFNTFGGIWQKVEFHETEPDLELPAPPCRVKVEDTNIFLDGKPFYLRGVLTWGWYPELGNHPCPDDDMIRREVRLMKELGFNTCKFCLWVPPHRYFEILEEEGMFAWLELPLWDPTPDPERQEAMFEELRRIVLQCRRHSNIIVWTCGCELSSNTTAEYRRRLYEMVKELTGAALVKDNSGSSEMYGGDLREYGDFYDFHPYCDLPFYPVVLDSLLIGPRAKKPILLGEFNDIDVHRDLPRIKRERPFWASSDPYLNDQGMRWEPAQLPRILEESRWADEDSSILSKFSLNKAAHLREIVQGAVRSREDIAGYVITGWRDTPISTSGMVDDWGDPKPIGVEQWNAPTLLFPIPFRNPPWISGGNRPGWNDVMNRFEGDAAFRFGAACDRDLAGEFYWKLESVSLTRKPQFELIAEGKCPKVSVRAGEPAAIGEFMVPGLAAGSYALTVCLGETLCQKSFLQVLPKPEFSKLPKWRLDDPEGLLSGLTLGDGPFLVTTGLPGEAAEATLAILHSQGTMPTPIWRESAFEFPRGFKDFPIGPFWDALFSFSGDRVIDLDALRILLPELSDVEVLINRVDTRTYAEAPILLRAKVGKGTLVATTLRPFGGLGCQPYGVMNNPAGADLLVKLMKLAEED